MELSSPAAICRRSEPPPFIRGSHTPDRSNHHAPRADAFEESTPPALGALVAIKSLTQPVNSLPKLRRAHARRLVVHVEKRAQVPAPGLENAIFLQESRVERRAGKRGQDCD